MCFTNHFFQAYQVISHVPGSRSKGGAQESPSMPVVHSKFNGAEVRSVCSCALLPIKTRFPGPAPALHADEAEGGDIIEEALKCFRWNILFKNFEVLGDGDRLLVYLTLWIQKCLFTADRANGMQDAQRQLEVLAGDERMPGPGDEKFLLAPFFSAGTISDSQAAKAYLKQLRLETVARLIQLLYPEGQPNKWWFQFSKKKFMGMSL